jgi:hypothetical protein
MGRRDHSGFNKNEIAERYQKQLYFATVTWTEAYDLFMELRRIISQHI